MNFTISEFRDISLVAFFLYIFYETKIYLALWVALFHVLNAGIKLISVNATTYKALITFYVAAVLVGYLYVFRNILLGKEKPTNSSKLKSLSTDKTKKQRIGIAILLLLVINVIAVVIFVKD